MHHDKHELPTQEETCRILEDAFNVAPIAKTYGMSLKFNQENQAVFSLPYNPNFNHGLGGIHGGVFATLLDNAGWFTAAAFHRAWVVTVEFQTRLLEGVKEEDLWAIGRIVRSGKKITVCDMEIRTRSDQLVATGSGSFFVTTTPVMALKK